MTPEQLNELKTMIDNTRAALDEVDAMIVDVNNCTSEISKKYLYAAIKKQASNITSHMKTIE